MTVTQLDEYTHLVLAPNPSPMTLDGTNTYILSAPDSDAAIVVDPGPDLAEHFDAVESVLHATGTRVQAVITTHHHLDHAEAAGWADVWGAPLHAFAPHRIPAQAAPLRDGDAVTVPGVATTAIYTPGHTSDHVCVHVAETNAVLTGDHVLGKGTTVILHPDGDMGAYLASLDRLAKVNADVLYPAHGPMIADPAERIAGYIAHRLEREEQVLAAIEHGATTGAEVVARIYGDLAPRLAGAALATVEAHIAHLRTQGKLPPSP